MSWHEFLIAYTAFTAVVLWIARPLFRKRWNSLLRCLVCTACLSFLFDYPAEDRGLWVFSADATTPIVGVPLENILFMANSAICTLVLYLGFRILFQAIPGHSETECQEPGEQTADEQVTRVEI